MTFEVHQYIKAKYGDVILQEFVEDHGQNGLDNLYFSSDESEVDCLLEGYLDL